MVTKINFFRDNNKNLFDNWHLHNNKSRFHYLLNIRVGFQARSKTITRADNQYSANEDRFFFVRDWFFHVRTAVELVEHIELHRFCGSLQ